MYRINSRSFIWKWPATMKTNNFKVSSKLNSLSSFKRGQLQDIKPVSIFLLAALVAAFFGGCDPSGSVGGGFAGPETDVSYDTTAINEIHIDTLFAYTGNLDYFSAGRFQDPLFGDITATGIFRPPLASNRDSLAFDNGTSVILNLAVNPETVYGDSIVAQTFSLYEARERWRGNQWRINENMPISSTPVATFTVEEKDTLIQVPLSDSWVEEYGTYFNLTESNRDSIYVREFFGMVVVPENETKIVTMNMYSSSLLATNLEVVKPDSEIVEVPRLDSLTIQLDNGGEWAYSLDRSNVNASPQSSAKMISTYERIIRFDHDFTLEDIKRRNIARVEIIFYVDKLLLEQSIDQAGAAAVRPESTLLRMHYIEGDELPQALSQYNQKNGLLEYVEATYNEEDKAYHFNVTRQVKTGYFEATQEERDFYITIGENDGVVRSGLLFNSLATGKNPKVVVTYVETDN